jgi:GntR family transcriptional regulator
MTAQGLDRASGVPLFRQLADRLRRAVLDGTLPPGHRLPSERDLMTQFDVSRDAVRRALGLLKAEGWTEVRHGSGYYVRADLTPEAIELLLGVDEDERGIFHYRHAQDWGLLAPTVIAWQRPTSDVARRLGVDPAGQVLTRDRLIGPNGGPVRQLATTYLPAAMVEQLPRLAEPDTGPTGFLGLMEAAGISLAFVLTIASRMPLPDEARALDLGQGQPVLRLVRTTYRAGTDDAVEVTDYRLPGPRYEVAIPLADRRPGRGRSGEQDLAD